MLIRIWGMKLNCIHKKQWIFSWHKFVLNLSQRLDLISKHVTLQNLSIYYTWKNIRKQYKNNKLKIIAPTWSDKFELPVGSYSVSDIQDYIEHIIKKHETLTKVSSTHVYINITNTRLVFKIKDGFKLEVQTPETVKLFGSTEKLTEVYYALLRQINFTRIC